ncbi:hypothetical protein BDW75DRAFT_244369 [Aspergillus navahoensis]
MRIQQVKAGIEALINFIEMLFQWDDIRCSKDVIHTAIKLWMQHQVVYLPKARDAFNEQIEELEDEMDEWAKVTDRSGLGSVSQKPSHKAPPTRIIANFRLKAPDQPLSEPCIPA